MSITPRFERLEQLTDELVREQYDAHATRTQVGTGFYLDELRCGNYERTIKATNDLARRTFWLGVANGGFALMTTVAAIIA
ncbi:MAG: hypothetical protein M3R63_03210 [Actinomycetota bacterium]|nr:hypothetical protein [Actinomycetota bacterium]